MKLTHRCLIYVEVDNKSELHIAGRLDADTTGLVLITDDGSWSFNIITPSKYCEKTYRVGLSKPIKEEAISAFQQGIQLQGEDKLTMPAKLSIISPQEVLLTITEGKFHTSQTYVPSHRQPSCFPAPRANW